MPGPGGLIPGRIPGLIGSGPPGGNLRDGDHISRDQLVDMSWVHCYR